MKNLPISIDLLLFLLYIPGLVAAQTADDSPLPDDCNMILPEHAGEDIRLRGFSIVLSRWVDQIVPVEINITDDAHRNAVLQAIRIIHQKTNVCIVPRTDEEDYISFEKSNSTLSSSQLGRVGGMQVIQLGTPSYGVVLHEIGHALGLVHEHQRPDRDEYVEIFRENINPDYWRNFEKLFLSGIYEYQGPYDYESIMHYHSHNHSQNGQPTILPLQYPASEIGQRSHFSEGDIAAINAMYPRPLGDCEEVLTSYPPVIANITDAGRWEQCRKEVLHLLTPLAFLPATTFEWHFTGIQPGTSGEYQPVLEFPFAGIYDIGLEIRRNGTIQFFTKQITISDTGLNFNLGPNPTTGLLNLFLTGRDREPAKIRVFTTAGQLMWEEQLELENDCSTYKQIDLTDLSPGLYLVSVVTSTQQSVQKIVIHQ